MTRLHLTPFITLGVGPRVPDRYPVAEHTPRLHDHAGPCGPYGPCQRVKAARLKAQTAEAEALNQR